LEVLSLCKLGVVARRDAERQLRHRASLPQHFALVPISSEMVVSTSGIRERREQVPEADHEVIATAYVEPTLRIRTIEPRDSVIFDVPIAALVQMKCVNASMSIITRKVRCKSGEECRVVYRM
jgi:hypothetical protein